MIKSRVCKKIYTKDTKGDINGYIVEHFKEGDKTQTYMTVTLPRMVKGIHYHDKYDCRFICIEGIGRLVIDSKEVYPLNEDCPIEYYIPKNNGILLINDGDKDMKILSSSVPSFVPEKGDYVSMTLDPVTLEEVKK